MISTLRYFAVQTRILSKECNIIADVYVRSTAQDDVKFARHPELGATHVDTWVNVGGICNAYLKSFSGSINVDKRLRNKCAIVCVDKNFSLLGERASVRVKRVTHAREGDNFSNKVYSLFTTHHSLIHNDTDFSCFTSY